MSKQPLFWQEITGVPEALSQAYRLRVLAWRTQVEIAQEVIEWKDAVDDYSRHWGVFVGQELIAAVRLSLHATISDMPHPEVYGGLFPDGLPAPIAYYARSAVHPEYRRMGLLTQSHKICSEAAFRSGATCIVSVVGSVNANRFVGESLQHIGFTFAGIGQPYAALPYQAAQAPAVYIRILKEYAPSMPGVEGMIR